MLLVSLELEEIRSLADRMLVIYEGRIVAELAPERHRRGARRGDARRAGSAGVSARADRAGRPVTRRRRRLSGYCAAAASWSPIITALRRVLRRRPRRARRPARNPIDTYKAIFEGSGLNWLFPWVTGDDRDARRAQPAADADPDDAADPHRPRGRVRVPRRPVQHRRPGPVPRRHVRRGLRRLVARRDAGAAARRARDRSPACAAGAIWAGIAGLLKATTGANEVISTIMLNWTARLRRPLPVRARRAAAQRRPAAASIPVSDDMLRERAAAGVLGRSGAAGPAHRHLHRARGGGPVLGPAEPLGDGLRGRGRSASTRTRREYGGISAGRNYVQGDGHLRAARRAWPARWTCSAGSSGSPRTTSRSRRSASSGSPSRCSGATRRSGPCVAALLFGALLNGTSVRNLDPAVFDPQLATNLTYIIQGLIVLFVSAPVLVTMLHARAAHGASRSRCPSPKS